LGLFRVVKDNAHSVAMAGSQPADSVPQINAIGSARPLYRAVVDCEHHAVALAQRYHLGSRLHAWSLFGQDELAAGEIPLRFREQNGHLQRKDVLTIQILMERIVVTLGVLQQERCRPRLPRLVA
jgi:hypothetical protein